MAITWLTAIAAAASGVCVGVLATMFGIGGGIIMVPLIHVLFGQPAALASGTSLFAILPTSLSGMLARLHDGTINFRVGLSIGITGALLSPLGAVAATNLPGMYAMLLTACFIVFTAYNMFKRVWRSRPGATAPVRRFPAPLKGLSGWRLYVTTAVVGAVTGFISGYIGLGGGVIIVPLLLWAYDFSIKQATGTSLVAVALFSVPSFITHAVLGNVLWVVGALLIVGSFVGTRIGARVVRVMNERLLTGLFGVLLLVCGIILVVQELSG